MKRLITSLSPACNKLLTPSCSASSFSTFHVALVNNTSLFKSFSTIKQFSQQNNASVSNFSSSTIEEIIQNLPDPSTLNIKPRHKKERVERNKTRQTWRDRPKITPKFLDTLPTVSFRQINIRQGPKKVNEVTEMLRGISAKEALIQLQSCEKKIAAKVYRFIRSCMLNAENIHGMNADRLLIRECIVNKQAYAKRLRYHAKGRFGIEQKRKTSIVVKMVEVPEIEGEHRLGRYGWTNKTWESYEQDMLNEKSEVIEPEMEQTASTESTPVEEVIAEPVEEVKAEESPENKKQ